MTAWRQTVVAPDGTHHLIGDRPLYPARFLAVLKYHEPGLAPVRDGGGAYHIDASGRTAYAARFRRTFGFYEGRAAAIAQDGGWLHILPDGAPLSAERYRFCGNFQEGRCVVRDQAARAYHLDLEGGPAYPARHRYAGDYRDGCAVIQRQDGLHGHVDREGAHVHDRWFLDLDVFHKGLARARDEHGWHHVDRSGRQVYRQRFAMVEPFYNGQARVETENGSLLLIDEGGGVIDVLRAARRSDLQSLSAEMVGFWRTQTLRVAVELGLFEALPGPLEDVAARCRIPPALASRLARALEELGVLTRDQGWLHLTSRGSYLQDRHPLSLAPAARLWGGAHYLAWADLGGCLRSGEAALQGRQGVSWFDLISQHMDDLRVYHRALASYARHDYQALPAVLDLSCHQELIDAGGGTGELLLCLLRAAPTLRGTLIERSEVAGLFAAPAGLADRIRILAGDLLTPWQAMGDAIVLARVLHDFHDGAAATILGHARRALRPGGRIYVIEMILPPTGGEGGLLDLNMLVMTGGRERTRDEFAALFGEADLVLREVRALPSVSAVLIAEAR